MTYKPITQIPFFFQGGTNTVQSIPDRPLTNLRLYAGQPDPGDPARFFIPFQCDGGTGRFQFQLDTDLADGGQTVPTVEMAWYVTPAGSP